MYLIALSNQFFHFSCFPPEIVRSSNGCAVYRCTIWHRGWFEHPSILNAKLVCITSFLFDGELCLNDIHIVLVALSFRPSCKC